MAIFGVAGYLKLHNPAAPIVATLSTAKRLLSKAQHRCLDLSGLQVAAEVNQRPVVGVMIENSQPPVRNPASAKPVSFLKPSPRAVSLAFWPFPRSATG